MLDALRKRLMEPSSVALFISEFTAEWSRLQAEAEAGAGRAQQECELAQIERRLVGLIDAIADGLLVVASRRSSISSRPARPS